MSCYEMGFFQSSKSAYLCTAKSMRKLFLLLSNIAGKGIIVSVWVVSKSLMHFLNYNGCKIFLYNVYKQTKNLYLDDNDNMV